MAHLTPGAARSLLPTAPIRHHKNYIDNNDSTNIIITIATIIL